MNATIDRDSKILFDELPQAEIESIVVEDLGAQLRAAKSKHTSPGLEIHRELHGPDWVSFYTHVDGDYVSFLCGWADEITYGDFRLALAKILADL